MARKQTSLSQQQRRCMTKPITYIDPPQGWLYDFPKQFPDGVTDVKAWLIEQGYPQEQIDNMGNSFVCRYWQELEDE